MELLATLFGLFWEAFFRAALTHIPEIASGIRTALTPTVTDAVPDKPLEDALQQQLEADIAGGAAPGDPAR